MGRILSISSLVTRGRVGNAIAVPMLEALGHEVWAMPTIQLSSRPGLGTVEPQAVPADMITRFTDALAADGQLERLDGVLTGYLPSDAHVQAAAAAVRRAKAANPDLIYLCDPVMGDEDKGLYIDARAAQAIRSDLIGLADVATPNLFELQWLVQSGQRDVRTLAERLAPPWVAVTSAGGHGAQISNLLVPEGRALERHSELYDGVPNGTGDLFAALLLEGLVAGRAPDVAFASASDRLKAVIQRSVGGEVLTWSVLFSETFPAFHVSGVDGCPGGWVAVHWDGGDTARAELFESFSALLQSQADIIAVDMPIGLPDMAGRACESLARQRLGQRQSSVFAVPSRAAAMEEDYRRSCEVNLAHSDPPKKVSKQCFNLLPKIRQIDALITPEMQARVFEVHPELAFWALNGEASLPVAKKIKSRANPEGLEFRRALLRANGFPIDTLVTGNWPKSKVGEDDILDACACAWSAMRIFRGEHVTLPQNPVRDGRGLRMEINA
ncbi:MAG: pyridoxal kinase [Pseudomonadota bacterium]